MSRRKHESQGKDLKDSFCSYSIHQASMCLMNQATTVSLATLFLWRYPPKKSPSAVWGVTSDVVIIEADVGEAE